jgi:enoyl-CoA hydratase
VDTRDTSPPAVTLETRGEVALVRLDDGRANALSHAVVDQLETALDDADGAAGLALVGRPGKFCAGFDLSVVREGPAAAAELMDRGARVALRLFEWPTPSVLGVTGHALAMGAVFLCCADWRIGTDGDFKLGLNEVAIGLAMPEFASELARTRLATRQFHEAVALARIYGPRAAAEAGYLDEVGDDDPDATVEAAVAKATELSDYLDARAFARTRRALRGPLAEHLRQGLGEALRKVSGD